MIKQTLGAIVALYLFAAPSIAFAQEKGEAADRADQMAEEMAQDQAEEEALIGRRTFAPINYNVAEDPEIIFHRVIDGFMAQGGDPTGTGQGGSELPDLKAEFNPMPHVRGTVSMARATEEDSANSQFFIVFYPRFALDRKYTVFGRVIGGMQYVDKIQRGEPPENPTRILQASLASQHKGPPTAATPAPAAITVDQLSNSVSD